MAVALNVDREQVKMLVQSIGCTETAKQTGIALNTVLQWSSRFGWLQALREKQKLPASMTHKDVIGVIKPSDALQNTLVDDSKVTRLAASRAIRKGFAALAAMPGEEIIAQGPNVASLTKAASQVHGWQEGQTQMLRVAIYRGGDEPPVIDV